MKVLVTGSAGHLGEALVRVLRGQGHATVGIDVLSSPFTDIPASITVAGAVREAMRGVDAVLHAATLHKPHVATHTRTQFVDTNVQGTLNVLEAALAEGVRAVVMTSSTSVFGAAMSPPAGAPAAWIDETVQPVPKNIYGVTKLAAEGLCELFARRERLPAIVLRTSRFFPENDDAADVRAGYPDANVKVNELLHRRADIEDIVSAHLCALGRAPALGFGRFIVSATTPFTREDVAALRHDAASLVRARVPGCADEYARRGWSLFPSLDRVYDNTLARTVLGWEPVHDYAGTLRRLAALPVDAEIRSPLAQLVGSKGYHAGAFSLPDGAPYPV